MLPNKPLGYADAIANEIEKKAKDFAAEWIEGYELDKDEKSKIAFLLRAIHDDIFLDLYNISLILMEHEEKEKKRAKRGEQLRRSLSKTSGDK